MAYHYCSHTASCFFGWRNGKQIDPVENVNYTQETLRYMTTPKRADEVTELILERFQFDGITLYESNGGIGGNTMSFLDNPRFAKVITTEILPDRYQMLVNNLSAYEFPLERYQVILGGFTPPAQSAGGAPVQSTGGAPPSTLGGGGPSSPFTPAGVNGGAVVYMDPPWLAESDDPLSSQNYLLENIAFGGKTLEEWLVACQHCPMVVIRVPPGYKLKPVNGFDYEKVNIKKSLVYVCRSKTAMSMLYQQILAQSFPISDLRDKKEDYRIKVKLLQYQLYQKLLVPIIPDPIVRLAYVSKDQMKVWIDAFTHRLYDIENNYEKLEFEGDAKLKEIITEEINRRFPDLTEEEMTNAKHFLEQATTFSRIGKDLELVKYAFLPIPVEKVHDKVSEDLFESFVGALYRVATNVQGVEAHTITSRILEYQSLKDLLNETRFGKNAVTKMKDYITEFGMGSYGNGKFYAKQKGKGPPEFSPYIRIDSWQDSNRMFHLKLTLSQMAINAFYQFSRNYHVPISLPTSIGRDGLVIAEQMGQDQPIMKLMEQGLATLANYGINEKLYELAKDERLKRKINSEVNLWDSLKITLKDIYRRDVKDFEIISSKELIKTGEVFAQLYAILSPGLPVGKLGDKGDASSGTAKEGKETYVFLHSKILPRAGESKIDTTVKQQMIQEYLDSQGMGQFPILLKTRKNLLVVTKDRKISLIQALSNTNVNTIHSVALKENESIPDGRRRLISEVLAKG